MKKAMLLLFMGVAFTSTGCTMVGDDMVDESSQATFADLDESTIDESSQATFIDLDEGMIEEASHAFFSDPEAAAAFAASSEMGIESCQSSYDSDVAAVRNYIQNNCGGITSCGSGDNFNHADVFIGGSYCDCYNKLWANRGSGAFSRVQIIYHESQACTWPHIHIEKKNLCGRIHYDVDEANNGTNCWDDEPYYQWDRWKGGGSCTVQHDSRIGTCN